MKNTKLERKYVRVRREKKSYEKDIVDKCKEEPKLSYRFINGKIKQINVTKLKENNEVYGDSKEMSEVLNKNFLTLFTTESDLRATRTSENKWDVGNQDN